MVYFINALVSEGLLWFIISMLLYLRDYFMVHYIISLVSEGLGRPYLMECFEEAKKLVDDAYKYSRDE